MGVVGQQIAAQQESADLEFAQRAFWYLLFSLRRRRDRRLGWVSRGGLLGGASCSHLHFVPQCQARRPDQRPFHKTPSSPPFTHRHAP